VRPAWSIVAVVWVTLGVAYGLYFSFPIFFVPLLEEFHWSRGLTAGALSVSTVVQGILSPLVGALIDRFGTRPVIVVGVLLLAGSAALTATVQTPWELYLYTGVIGAMGMVCLGWVPMGVLVARWFSERRGRMVGIAFSGMGIGIFVIGPLAQWLIAHWGWRAASVALGVGGLLALLPLVWRFARDPDPRVRPGPRSGATAPAGTAAAGGHSETTGSWSEGRAPLPPAAPTSPTLKEAMASRAFWALAAAYLFTPLAVFPVFTHQVAFAVDLGFPPMFAASVFGVMGLMSSVGRVVFGLLADRVGGPVAATISFGCTAGGALALLLLETSPRPAWLVVYALLFGLGFGARGPIITSMATDLFGGRRFGAIYGLMNTGNGLGSAIGPWFGGVVHDVSGSYRVAFLASVVFSVMGAACFWLARRRLA